MYYQTFSVQSRITHSPVHFTRFNHNRHSITYNESNRILHTVYPKRSDKNKFCFTRSSYTVLALGRWKNSGFEPIYIYIFKVQRNWSIIKIHKIAFISGRSLARNGGETIVYRASSLYIYIYIYGNVRSCRWMVKGERMKGKRVQ